METNLDRIHTLEHMRLVEGQTRYVELSDRTSGDTVEQLLRVLKAVDQELLKAAVAGERFAEYFYANSQDEAISAYLRELTGAPSPKAAEPALS